MFVLVNIGVPECNEYGEKEKTMEILKLLNKCRFSTKTIQIIKYILSILNEKLFHTSDFNLKINNKYLLKNKQTFLKGK